VTRIVYQDYYYTVYRYFTTSSPYSYTYFTVLDLSLFIILKFRRWTRARSECLPVGLKIIVTPLLCMLMARAPRTRVTPLEIRVAYTGVDKGEGPGPTIAGKKKLVKTEGLSSLPPAKSGRACYDNPTGRGHFYQMPNMCTCIAYLIETRKFCSKKPGS